MAVKQLEVWDHDRHVATLRANRPWDLRCSYGRAMFDDGHANRPLLSCSLPVVTQRQQATPWVRGLLPEGQHLTALATDAGVPTNYYTDLLARYGRDIAGAFSISVDPPEPARWSIEAYTDTELADELRTAIDAPGFAVRDDSELSIAGLQNKLLVCDLGDGRWGRPVNGQPSTHIMKLDDGKRPGLLAAEHACLELAAAAGLPAATTTLLDIDAMAVLAVKRYDRTRDSNGTIVRLHQEDACQALGVNIDAHQGRGKYEQYGGPSFAQTARVLDQYGDPVIELPQLLSYAVFTWLIGNGDAHGKNISILIDTTSGDIRLAPLYDTVPTALWPELRTTTAMSVNHKFDGVTGDDFVTEAHQWRLGTAAARRSIERTIHAVRAAADASAHAEVAELVTGRCAALAATLS